MKKLSILGLVLLGLTCWASCSDFLDINYDPNYPSDTTPEMLLSSGIISVAGIVGGDMELVGGFWSQHYTQNNSSNQYNTTVAYNVSISSYNGFWSVPYASSLPDLQLVISKAETDKLWGHWVMAKTMTAFNFHLLADWYAAAPYTEALQGSAIPNPKYDDGKVINTNVLAILDAVIAKKADALIAPSAGTADLVFGGDVNAWIQFATTLKLKILMRDFEANKSAIQALITAGGFLTQNAWVNKFEDKENNSNPLYENDRRKLNTSNNIRGCVTLIDFLNHYDDPRAQDFFEPTSSEYGGVIAGLKYGDQPTAGERPLGSHSRARVEATDPVYFMSVAEAYFLVAEAWARIGNAANAKTAYDLGVSAAFSRYGHSAASFIAAGGAYAFDPTSANTMLTNILTQKWIAATRCQAWDAFFDINRTGIPALGITFPGDPGYVWATLTPCINSFLPAGEFPKRMLYPKTSSDYNQSAPQVIPLTTKMWWQK